MISCHVYIFSDVVGTVLIKRWLLCVVLAGSIACCGMRIRSRSV